MVGFIMSLAAQQHRSRSLQPSYALGVDFGTSGVRCGVVRIGSKQVELVTSNIGIDSALKSNIEDRWFEALWNALEQIPDAMRRKVTRVGVDATSASVVLDGQVKMYNYAEANEVVEEIVAKMQKAKQGAHAAASATSSLAKLMAWGGSGQIEHQADVVSRMLLDGRQERGPRRRVTDWNNALKLGYDAIEGKWPEWVRDLVKDDDTLMDVVRPGCVIGEADASWAFAHDCQVVAGTTDSIAAFIASGANEVGAACTSLGSTLAIKLLSTVPVDEGKLGVYSHRFFLDASDERSRQSPLFLVGGASNVGGEALKQLGFTSETIGNLCRELDLNDPFPNDHLLYPLPPYTVGERFPVYDTGKRPVLDHPDIVCNCNNPAYLRALLESIAQVEADGYEALTSLGAPKPTHVYSAGGGAENPAYLAIRGRRLNLPVSIGQSAHACVGAALLACPR